MTKIKILYLLPIVFLSLFLISIGTKVVFAACDCPSGWYECNGGTYCCTGGGCPSAVSTCGECNEWVYHPEESHEEAETENYVCKIGTRETQVPCQKSYIKCDKYCIYGTCYDVNCRTVYYTGTCDRVVDVYGICTRTVYTKVVDKPAYTECTEYETEGCNSGCYQCSAPTVPPGGGGGGTTPPSANAIIYGYIWQDLNLNKKIDLVNPIDSSNCYESWSKTSVASSCVKSNMISSSLDLLNGSTSMVNRWTTSASGVPIFVTNNLVANPISNYSFTLTKPSDYACGKWLYEGRNPPQVPDPAYSNTGVGCTASIPRLKDAGLYQNLITWEINKKPTVVINISGDGVVDENSVYAESTLTVTATITDPDGGPSYDYSWSFSGGNFTKDVSDGSRGVWITPSTTGNITITLRVTDTESGHGGTSNYTEINKTIEVLPKPITVETPWFSALDGDIFGNEIDVTFPETSYMKNDFENVLVQVSGDSQPYVFSKETNYGNSNSTSGTNSYAQNISISDLFLNNYLFKPGSFVEAEDFNGWSNLQNGKAYIVDSDEISIDSSTTYQVSSSGVSVLYVSYVNDTPLEINSNLKSNSGSLIIITDAPVEISDDIGYAGEYASYTTTSNSQIDAFIVSSDKVTIKTKETTNDLPLIIKGGLVSKGGILFERNLGDLYNMYPAEYVKYDVKAFYKLFEIEKNLNSDFITNTGVSMYDTQWIYSD